MSSKVYIGDLNKEDLIAALWSRSKPAAFFAMSGLPAPPFNKEDALRQAEQLNWCFDYLQGRVIKSDLSGEEADPWGYDRDNGAGAFREAVEGVRNKRKGVAKGGASSGSATAPLATVAASTPAPATSTANSNELKNLVQPESNLHTRVTRFFGF
ncbi:hypothetical protein BDW75DRAFT_242958 [Aspergillus navahoensis]